MLHNNEILMSQTEQQQAQFFLNVKQPMLRSGYSSPCLSPRNWLMTLAVLQYTPHRPRQKELRGPIKSAEQPTIGLKPTVCRPSLYRVVGGNDPPCRKPLALFFTGWNPAKDFLLSVRPRFPFNTAKYCHIIAI